MKPLDSIDIAMLGNDGQNCDKCGNPHHTMNWSILPSGIKCSICGPCWQLLFQDLQDAKTEKQEEINRKEIERRMIRIMK